EWSTIGDLRLTPSLAAGTISRDASSLLPSSQHRWHDRLLAGGAVDAGGRPSLFGVLAGRVAGDANRPLDRTPHRGAPVLRLRLLRAGRHRRDPVISSRKSLAMLHRSRTV